MHVHVTVHSVIQCTALILFPPCPPSSITEQILTVGLDKAKCAVILFDVMSEFLHIIGKNFRLMLRSFLLLT